jgi:hypothetical protein
MLGSALVRDRRRHPIDIPKSGRGEEALAQVRAPDDLVDVKTLECPSGLERRHEVLKQLQVGQVIHRNAL